MWVYFCRNTNHHIIRPKCLQDSADLRKAVIPVVYSPKAVIPVQMYSPKHVLPDSQLFVRIWLVIFMQFVAVVHALELWNTNPLFSTMLYAFILPNAVRMI